MSDVCLVLPKFNLSSLRPCDQLSVYTDNRSVIPTTKSLHRQLVLSRLSESSSDNVDRIFSENRLELAQLSDASPRKNYLDLLVAFVSLSKLEKIRFLSTICTAVRDNYYVEVPLAWAQVINAYVKGWDRGLIFAKNGRFHKSDFQEFLTNNFSNLNLIEVIAVILRNREVPPRN